MTLTVSVVKTPAGVSLAEMHKTFDENGGTIGRGDSNTWVLDDPDRFLSSKHCSLSFEGGQYYLTDMSTNGTFVNGAPEPVGKGGKIPLSNGDTIELGDYQFQIDMNVQFADLGNSSQQAPAVDPFGNADPFASGPDPFAASGPSSQADPFASLDPFDNADPFSQADPFASGASSDPFAQNSPNSLSLSPGPENVDPLAALDKANYSATSDVFSSVQAGASPAYHDPFASPTHSDGADALNQAVSWPDPVDPAGKGNLIPDDWDDLLGPEPSAPPPPPPRQEPIPRSFPLTDPPKMPPETARPQRPAAQEPLLSERPPERVEPFRTQEPPRQAKPPARSQTPPPSRPAQAASAPQARPTANNAQLGLSLIEAMGLADRSLNDEQLEEISALVGQLMPVIVKGMMQVLRSRTSIKNEFRMNVTTIQPIENNPLKFSATPEEAIDNMFVRKSSAYKHPIEAFREGFESIGEHQVAIIAGIRAAFKGMMDSFDPERLEQQFEKQNKGVALPGMQKARYWASYCDYFKGYVDNMENSFQYLFGDVFVEAYEDQMRKLAIEKKRHSSDGNF